MKQYCRYCSNIYRTGYTRLYCDAKEEMRTESSCKTVNNCKDFLLNPLDVLDDNLKKTYKPREEKKSREKKKSKGKQLKFK